MVLCFPKVIGEVGVAPAQENYKVEKGGFVEFLYLSTSARQIPHTDCILILCVGLPSNLDPFRLNCLDGHQEANRTSVTAIDRNPSISIGCECASPHSCRCLCSRSRDGWRRSPRKPHLLMCPL